MQNLDGVGARPFRCLARGSAAAAEGRQDLALKGVHVLARDRSGAGVMALDEVA
jgi:hypothetical protein